MIPFRRYLEWPNGDRKLNGGCCWAEGRRGNYCLMGMEFQFGEMMDVLRRERGDGCSTMQMYLMLLNCTHRNDSNNTFYVLHFFHNKKVMHTQTSTLPLTGSGYHPETSGIYTCPSGFSPVHPSLASTISSPSTQSYSTMLELGSLIFVSLYTDHSHRRPDHPFSIRNIFLFHPFLASLITIRDKSCQQLPVCFPVSVPTSLQFYEGEKKSLISFGIMSFGNGTHKYSVNTTDYIHVKYINVADREEFLEAHTLQ